MSWQKKKNYPIFYYLEFSDYSLHLYSYIPNVSADVSFGLFLVFLVELGSEYNSKDGGDSPNTLNDKKIINLLKKKLDK